MPLRLFRAVFEKSFEPMLLTNEAGRYVEMNPAACELFGVPRAELAGRRPEEFITLQPKAGPARGAAGDERTRATLRRPDGTTRRLELSSTDNVVPGLHLTMARDVTGREDAEEELRESELRYRRIVELSPEPILVHVGRRIAFANTAAARVLGLASAEELVGRSIAEFADEATQQELLGRFERSDDQALVELAQQREQHFLRVDNGERVIVEVVSLPVTYDGQRAMLTLARDVTERRRAEREAEAARQAAELETRRLEAVLEALPVAVWLADVGGRLTRCNRAAVELWGGAPAELLDPGHYRAFWPSSGERSADWALLRALRSGETILAEQVEIERFDGLRAYGLSSAAPIRDGRGEVIGGVAVTLDVTERLGAAREREALIASLEFERRRLGLLLAKAPAYIALLRGPELVFDLVNDAPQKLLGHRELLGRPLSEVVPELEERYVHLLREVLSTGETFSGSPLPIDINLPNSPPVRRFVSVVLQALVEADGSRSGVFVHALDVTEQTLAQRRLRAQFNCVPVPTYAWQHDPQQDDFQLVDYNDAALAISRGLIASKLGAYANSFFTPASGIADDLRRALREGRTFQRRMRYTLSTTGEVKEMLVTYASAPPNLVIAHTEDVTERLQVEEQLQQAQKMEAIGRLAGGVAHDFNNLLSVILGYTDFLLEELREGDAMRADLLEVRHAAERASEQTRQLLAFSRKQLLEPRVMNLNTTLLSLDRMLRRLLSEDIELTLFLAPDLGLIYADAGQLEQVVINLAANARDAMPTGGKLTIETSNIELDADFVGEHVGTQAGSFVLLAVTDTGVGMSPEVRSRVFEPFFTTKAPGKGTGLGLSMVFGIVHQSGGHMWVYSEPEHGTSFKIYLPRAAQKEVTNRPTKIPVQGGTETVLLVEDEAQVRSVVRRVLVRRGYRVLEASNGHEALLLAEQLSTTIDLLLTDVVMPGMSGRLLVNQLSPLRPGMRVLFMSGYTDDAIVHHGILEAGIPFLQKPVRPDALLLKVRETLDADR